MYERGQTTIYDFMFAVLIFIILFGSLRIAWISNLNSGFGQQNLTQMELEAIRTSETLLKSEGKPKNWDSGNVEVIGLAEIGKDNVLDEGKINEFGTLAYDDARGLMKINYEFLFELDSVNDAYDVNVGNGTIPAGSTVVSVKRAVYYKGVEAVVYFKVFE